MKHLYYILLLTIALQAVEVSLFELQTESSNVALKEPVNVYVQIVTDSDVDIPTPRFTASPDYTVLQVRRQPPQHRSSYQIINGKTSSSVTYTHILEYLIEFKRKGSVTLPPLTTTVAGKKFSTQSIVFLVGSASSKPKSMEVIFLGKKQGLYRGERTKLTVQIRHPRSAGVTPSNQGISQLIQDIVSDLESSVSITNLTNGQIEQRVETINGISYGLYEIDYLVTMIDTGTITGGPYLFNYFKEKQQGTDFFGQPRIRRIDASISTPRLTYRVKSLPPAPKGFLGAMSPIKLTGSISTDSTPAGEGVTLQYKLSGSMTAKQLGEITLPKMPNVELFTPEKSSKTDTTKSAIYSSKSYRYILSPTKEGVVTIPQVTIPWFDTKSGTYKESKAGPFVITVTKGDGKPETSSRRYLTKETVKAVGEDIRAIKYALADNDITPKIYRTKLYLFLLLFPWVLALIALVIKVKLKYFPTDIAQATQKRALNQALRSIANLAKKNSSESLLTIIEKYLSQKLSIEAGGLRRQELAALLKNSKNAQALLSHMDAIEMSRYGGGVSVEELQQTTKQLLIDLNKELSQ